MVLVRKTELACRHGWDQDLWEPREGPKGGKTDRNPANRDTKSTKSSNGVASTLREPVSTPSGTDSVIEPDQSVEPRRAVEADSLPSDSSDSDRRHAESDSRRQAWSSAFDAGPGEADHAVDELQAETVVSRFGTRRSDWGEQSTGHRQQQHRADSPGMNRPADQLSDPIPNGNHGDDLHQRLNGFHPHDAQESSQTVQQSGLTEQFEAESAGPNHAGGRNSSAGVDEEIEPDSPMDMNDDAASSGSVELPVLQASNACCRNCRDFIPSKDGWRGWCSNPFAFETRREVPGDKVSCQSSFGSWWSPSDDWWMERADIAHHSAPTPLVDNLIRQIRSRYLTDEGSTEGQERS